MCRAVLLARKASTRRSSGLCGRLVLLGRGAGNDDEAVKSHLVQFFADKDQKFYEHGIIKLP